MNTIEEIINFISQDTSTPVDVIKSKTRERKIVELRQIGMWMARYLIIKDGKYGYGLKEIGKDFGGFDHATCIHSLKTIDNLCSTYSAFDLRIKNMLIRYDLWSNDKLEQYLPIESFTCAIN
jgi:chromosomal replication initiator protein